MSPTLHRTIDIEGIETFYREAGPLDAPAVLLPHGYPSSSFQYRHVLPLLADRWHLVAPDFPGFGYSATPPRDRFAYDFDAYATSSTASSPGSVCGAMPCTCTTTARRSAFGWRSSGRSRWLR